MFVYSPQSGPNPALSTGRLVLQGPVLRGCSPPGGGCGLGDGRCKGVWLSKRGVSLGCRGYGCLDGRGLWNGRGLGYIICRCLYLIGPTVSMGVTEGVAEGVTEGVTEGVAKVGGVVDIGGTGPPMLFWSPHWSLSSCNSYNWSSCRFRISLCSASTLPAAICRSIYTTISDSYLTSTQSDRYLTSTQSDRYLTSTHK